VIPRVDQQLTLRIASSDDEWALARLAALDEAPPLTGPVLLAEVGGSLRAAISLSDLRAIADPFEPTAALVQLLRIRGRQLQGTERPRRSLARRTPLGRLRALLSS